jgi:hypothetical protein
MKGATTEPWLTTNSAPKITKRRTKGASQNFFCVVRYAKSSFRNDILSPPPGAHRPPELVARARPQPKRPLLTFFRARVKFSRDLRQASCGREIACPTLQRNQEKTVAPPRHPLPGEAPFFVSELILHGAGSRPFRLTDDPIAPLAASSKAQEVLAEDPHDEAHRRHSAKKE